MVTTADVNFDYVLVGGGLQSGLIALALTHHRPNARIALIEKGDRLGGNHTWSLHETDLTESARPWLGDLIEHTWPGYSVRVGKTHRDVSIPYHTVSSSHFEKTITDRFVQSGNDHQIMTHADAVGIAKHEVRLSDGRVVRGSIVVDSRGPIERLSSNFDGGYQKFWGFELELPEDWPESEACIMDDAVEQSDGFRFFYTLPFASRRVLVEDTRFSNSSALNRDDCFAQTDTYLKSRTQGRLSLAKCKILREEHGVLPMPISGFEPRISSEEDGVYVGGYRGGWFHAATGYSFAMAMQFAETLASQPEDSVPQALQQLIIDHQPRARFARFLNRLLFRLVSPTHRYQIFQRFYRVMSIDRIARFYSHRFGVSDAMRMLVGIPPTALTPIEFVRSFQRGTSFDFRERSGSQPIRQVPV
ncbi:MAG: lycopene beta-cyclase CrtY [Planctomycetota bacterium]